MHECTKHNEIESIKKAVFGNGKRGLVSYMTESFQKIEIITKAVELVQADVKVLLQFQTKIEVKAQQEEIHEKKLEELKKEIKSDKKWKVGLTISTILGMLAIIVSLLTIIYSEPKADSQKVTEKEFQKLWEDYKKEHNTRGFVITNDSSKLTTNYIE